LVVLAGGGACARRWCWVLVVLVHRRTLLAPTSTVGIGRLRLSLTYVVNVCFYVAVVS
jgi:hypothetical protein